MQLFDYMAFGARPDRSVRKELNDMAHDLPDISDKPTAGRVLLVANYGPEVGFAWWLMENFWVQFAALARERNLEPLIAYPRPGQLPASIIEAGIATATLPIPGTGLSGLLASLRFIWRNKVKVVYFTDRGFSSLRYAAFRLAGVRLIINHDHTPGDRPPVRGLAGLLKAAWRRVPWINCELQVCVSPLIMERAIRNGRIPASRLAVVQNGIRPIECRTPRNYAHREFGIPDDATICITSGRANPYKRIDFVIEVARKCVIDLELDKLYFVYCGDGPDMPRLRALAESSGLGSRFVFAGTRSDMPALLCSSSIAIHAAKGEAFSLAIIEYMSAGLAVLVPDLPTVCQAIQDGRTGIVFVDGDSDEATQRLADLMVDRAYRERLGTAAVEEVRNRYSLEKMNTQFCRLFSRFLRG